jgi:hypothetical protein
MIRMAKNGPNVSEMFYGWVHEDHMYSRNLKLYIKK